nr:helix-turn-helix domain-containing protein [uncultured Sphingomonas sp.]
MAEADFAIGTLSRQSECNIETIRYYERIGLIPRAARRGRYRVYSVADVARLRFVKRARALGFPIEEIRALLELSESASAASRPSCLDARQIALSNLAAVRSRLDDLQRMEAILAEAIDACDLGTFNGCPILKTLSGAVTPAPETAHRNVHENR